jgi:hypothetical protein
VAYSFQESHTGQLDFCTDWQMTIQRDDVISIILCDVYYVDFLNHILYFSLT